MSLLDRVFSIRKLLKPGWILFIPVFFGCETRDDQGIQYDLDSNTSVRYEEFILPMTNFYLDSLATGSGVSILVGDHADDFTGQVTAEGYFQYFYREGIIPNDSVTIADTLTFPLKYDSAVFRFKVDGFALDPIATDSVHEFSVRELANNLISGVNYLAGLKQETNGTIGLFSKKINPVLDSVYTIKLSDGFGQALFEDLANIPVGEESILISKVFTDLGIVSEPGSDGISLIDLAADTTALTLYTSADTSAVDTTFQTIFKPGGQNYSHLVRDFSGSSFDGVESTQNFDLPDGRTVLDPLLGLTSAFSVLELEQFFSENESIIINSAVMSFELDNTQNAVFGREQLSRFYMFFRKPDDSIFGPATQTGRYRNIMLTDNSYLTGNPTLSVTQSSEDDDRVLLPCTLFFQGLLRQYLESNALGMPTISDDSLRPIDELVPISPSDVTLNRSIFSAQEIKLRIYYTEVN